MKGFLRNAVAVAAAMLALSLGLASANTKTVTDAQNDQGEETIDLKSASHGHTTTGKLVHKVVAYGTFDDETAGRISVQIKVGKKFYSVSTYGLWNQQTQTTSAVKVKRPADSSIKYVFKKGQIGKPGKYKWYVHSVPPFPCLECPDYLPDQQTTGSGSWVTHTL